MSTIDTTLQQVLKDHGLSLTIPRKTVLRALQHQEPQTMRQVVDACPGVDRASVYRIIALFEQLGIVQRLQIGWKYRLELSDAFHDHHHHLRCSICQRIISLKEDSDLESNLENVAKSHGFLLESHQIELSGICHNCQQARTLVA